MKIEYWKFIPGYEGKYQVSNKGRVKNVATGKILNPELTTKGYYRVKLCDNGVKKRFLLHRLVAIVFVPNPNNYPIVNHKDLNPKNCCADNLEWCDYRYNNSYDNAYNKRVEARKKNGTYTVTEETRKKIRKALLGKHSATSKNIIQLSKDGDFVSSFVSMRDASIKTGVCYTSITQVCKNERETAGGYKWKYVKDIHPFVLRLLKDVYILTPLFARPA